MKSAAPEGHTAYYMLVVRRTAQGVSQSVRGAIRKCGSGGCTGAVTEMC